jgi:hypothetical protein
MEARDTERPNSDMVMVTICIGHLTTDQMLRDPFCDALMACAPLELWVPWGGHCRVASEAAAA